MKMQEWNIEIWFETCNLPGISLSVLTIEKVDTKIKAGKYKNDKVFVLYKNRKGYVRLTVSKCVKGRGSF